MTADASLTGSVDETDHNFLDQRPIAWMLNDGR